MKKVFTLICTLTTFAVQAQNQPKKPTQQPAQTQTQAKPQGNQTQAKPQVNPFIEHFARKNALANRWNDQEQVKDALYDLIAENPANDSIVYVLAVYYYENQQYVSTVLITKDLLSGNPKNLSLLQLSASSYEALGIKDKALTNYESIYLLNNNTAVLYKMSVLQYDLKKYEESKINADILLTKPDIDSLRVTINDPKNKDKQYPLKASVLNLKGLLAQQANDKAAAKKAFEESLALSPDFPLAKENLAKIK